MTGPRRTDLRLKITSDIVGRFSAVRAVWLAVQNDPDLTVQAAALEFYYAVGALLEGGTLEQIDFRKIDRRRVLQHHKEG